MIDVFILATKKASNDYHELQFAIFFLTNYQTSHRLFLRQTFYVFSLMNEDTCQNVVEDLYYYYGNVIAEITREKLFWIHIAFDLSHIKVFLSDNLFFSIFWHKIEMVSKKKLALEP